MQAACLDGYAPASIDDLCTIHERSYVLGLERLVGRGQAELVDSSPTYITPSSFQDALKARALPCAFQLGCPSGMCPECMEAKTTKTSGMAACTGEGTPAWGS
jgi:hypothetical protein